MHIAVINSYLMPSRYFDEQTSLFPSPTLASKRRSWASRAGMALAGCISPDEWERVVLACLPTEVVALRGQTRIWLAHALFTSRRETQDMLPLFNKRFCGCRAHLCHSAHRVLVSTAARHLLGWRRAHYGLGEQVE